MSIPNRADLEKLHQFEREIADKFAELPTIARLNPAETHSEHYQESLKVYRDLKNSIDTAREEGRIAGRKKLAMIEERQPAVLMIRDGMDEKKVARYNGLTLNEVRALKAKRYEKSRIPDELQGN